MSDVDSGMMLKIKKLFTLAEGTPYKEEAETALMKAQELLCMNNLTKEEIDAEWDDSIKKEKEIVDLDIERKQGNTKTWQLKLINVITKNFRCFHYRERRSIKYGRRRKSASTFVVVGLKEDAKACKEAIQFIFKVYEQQVKAFVKDRSYKYSERGVTERLKVDYLEGFIEGLTQKFSENVTCKDLIIIKDDDLIDDFENRDYKNKKFYSRQGLDDQRAYHRGVEDGKHSTDKHKYIATA